MKFHIRSIQEVARPAHSPALRRSVVQVWFPDRKLSLAYYNARFDLHPGDLVYVSGKLEGLRGQVTAVNYNFRIRLSDYQCVTAVVDTAVSGQFFLAGSHLVTFDPEVLPPRKVSAWFQTPQAAEEEYVSGSDETVYQLNRPETWDFDSGVATRGRAYYEQNKVRYLCLDGSRGYALVEGTRPYEVEFDCRNGEVRHLTCPCYCGYPCKHEFAVLLQLRKTLDWMHAHQPKAYARGDFFAAISRETLFRYAVDGKESGTLTLSVPSM